MCDNQEKKLNIGVFGGARGHVMIDLLLHHPDARLVAVCDKYEPLLDKVRVKAAQIGTKVACYTSFDEFLTHPGLDAVVLANYANEHAVFAVRCLRAGKHVLSECLPCETMAQAVELIETVEETGLVYAYAENYCYMHHTFEMWRRYRSGELGEVLYGEGEYIHDCSSRWPDLTYGERDHWRNRQHANFYCTHSLGPLITITGLRPKSVVGFETAPMDCLIAQGCVRGAGIEMVTMENGAVFKSIHGSLKREPSSVNYEVYCTKGMMESGRFAENKKFNLYKEGETLGHGCWEHYNTEPDVARELREQIGVSSHGGSDFYPTHCFLEKILGREDGKWSIDVYTAIDMGICGILAFRSTLAGNVPIAVPNLRNKAERDAYRHDNISTNAAISGDDALPPTSHTELLNRLDDEVYAHVRQCWLQNEAKRLKK